MMYLAVFLSAAAALAQADLPRRNYSPFVLMHGFAGWGPEELFGIRYFGAAFGNFESSMSDAGYDTVTVSMGPVSSNWDRACEAYGQLVGRQVDFGAARVQQFPEYQTRWGDDYTGQALLPSLEGGQQRFHIIAHSQGGQTARLLASLLVHGAPEEVAAAQDVSGLFVGGKHWVASITMLSTPNHGTSLASSILSFEFVVDIIIGVAGIAGLASDAEFLYDLDLDQFGMTKRDDESVWAYLDRVLSDPTLDQESKAFGPYALTPEGSREQSDMYDAEPDVYYMTYSNEQTFDGSLGLGLFYLPEPFMFLPFFPTATVMGSFRKTITTDDGQEIKIDKEWGPNDGVVNMVSMDCAYSYKGEPCPDQGHLKDPVNMQPGIFHSMYLWHTERQWTCNWDGGFFPSCGWETVEVRDPNMHNDHFDMISDFTIVEIPGIDEAFSMETFYVEAAMQAAALPIGDSREAADRALPPRQRAEDRPAPTIRRSFDDPCESLVALGKMCGGDAPLMDEHICERIANRADTWSPIHTCKCDTATEPDLCHVGSSKVSSLVVEKDRGSKSFGEKNALALSITGGLAGTAVLFGGAFFVMRRHKKFMERMRSPSRAPLSTPRDRTNTAMSELSL